MTTTSSTKKVHSLSRVGGWVFAIWVSRILLALPAVVSAGLFLFRGSGQLAPLVTSAPFLAKALLMLPTSTDWRSLAGAFAGVFAAQILFSVGALLAAFRLSSDVRGRRRLMSYAFLAIAFDVCVTATFVYWLMRYAPASGAGISAYPLGTSDALIRALLIGCGALVFLEMLACWSVWFLVREATRARIWFVVDAIVFVLTLLAGWVLPFRVPVNQPEEAPWVVAALAVTALFAVRAFLRFLPLLFSTVELQGFEALVAARMLRARKSGFLTIIGSLSILAVSFSSCTLTTTLSVMGGFRDDLRQKIIGNNAHLVVDREYGTFEGWQQVRDTIESTPHVVGANPFARGEVMISSASNLAGAELRGVDPDAVVRVTALGRNLRRGHLEFLDQPERLLELSPSDLDPLRPLVDRTQRQAPTTRAASNPNASPSWVRELALATGTAQRTADELSRELLREAQPDERPHNQNDSAIDSFVRDDIPAREPARERPIYPGLVIGQELARTLRVTVGDEVQVVSPFGDLGPTGPVPKARHFRIAAIFYSGMYEFDEKVAYAALPAAQRFLGLGSAIHGFEVAIESFEASRESAVEITHRLHAAPLERRELRARAWQDVNVRLFGALALEKLAMFITLGIAILVASFCILGTLSLMVQEKRREVGMLKAMGANEKQLVRVFLLQGILIGSIGSASGLGLGYLMCFLFERVPLPLSADVYYINHLPVHVDASEFLWVGVASMVVCILSTLYPAYLGSQLKPLEALRD